MIKQMLKGLVLCALVACASGCSKPSGDEAKASEAASAAPEANAVAPIATGGAVNPGTLIKSGLWSLKATGNYGSMGMNAKVCIGKDYGKAFSGGFASRSESCESVTAHQEGGSIIVDATCEAGAGKLNIKQIITPESDTHFTQVTQMRMEPAQPGMPEMKTTTEGTYEGPCPEGTSEGVIIRH